VGGEVVDLRFTAASMAGLGDEFETGTTVIFNSIPIPPGWVRDLTLDEHTIKVTDGSITQGGTVNFVDVFKNNVPSGGHTLTERQCAVTPHRHAIRIGGTSRGTLVGGNEVTAHCFVAASDSATSGTGGADNVVSYQESGLETIETTSTTANSPHTHPLNLSVKYIDIAVANKI